MNEFFHRLYEGQVLKWLPPLYKANPCDVGAAKWFQHVGEELERLTSQCPCCTGARVFVTGAFGAAFPRVAALLLGGYAVYVMLIATFRCLFDKEPG